MTISTQASGMCGSSACVRVRVRVRVRVGCGTLKAKILWVVLGMNDLTQPPVLYSAEEEAKAQ